MSNRTWCGARLRRWSRDGFCEVSLKRVRGFADRRKRTLLRVVSVAAALSYAIPATAQTPYVPYYGKNQIRYDNFEWYHYETDHFIMYYYPEIEPHLERMAGYAESAYQHVSSELKHDLAHKVPLILFQTSSEFQQQNVIPGAAQEGVGAFAEPTRQRIVMPMDEPPDLLYRLIVHELTHQFDYDIIPASLVRRTTPLWLHEGLADYMTGFWRPLDLMSVRDAAVADIIPKMTRLEGYSDVGGARMIYNLGHAVFEFIESRWGKEGIRQYLFSLRKSVIGGGEDAYEETFKITADEFDSEFDKHLKDRFKPFRDKERPADYGRNLVPNPEKSPYRGAYTVEPSPSSDLLAIFTGNAKDQEGDIVIVSARDGSEFRNLTKGFDYKLGFEYIATSGNRWVTVPQLSWSTDDNLAYFARSEKSRSLILQNVITREIVKRIDMKTVDDPESPDFSPDGRRVAFAALQGGTGDIFVVDIQTEEVTNITKDGFADSGPTWAPDGRSIVYLARISGNEKLFRVDLATGEKTQLTFGTHDDATAHFLDDNTLVFPSTATDPAQPIDPDVARNGQIYNVWMLDLKTGELRQYTDAVGGNLYTAVLKDGNATPRLIVVTYHKGEYELHVVDRRDPIVTAASSDFGAPGPIIDFQAPLSHTIVASNKKKKGKFENMFLDGRPPVSVGVTSSGDVFGGTAVTFSDVLGDQQFSVYVASISQYRTLSFAYTNLASRFNYMLQAYSQTEFFYGNMAGVFYDPVYSGLVDRDLAIATRSVRGGSVYGIWPLSRYRRLELTAGVANYNESFNDPVLDEYSEQYQQDNYGRQLFRSGTFVPLGINFIQETTVFREFGPVSGSTMRLSYELAPPIGNTLTRQTFDVDARYYQRLASTGVLALRARAFRSRGDSPDFMYFGGNSEMRGYEYLQFAGDTAAFFNAELRFPLINAMLTPIGVLGGVRGVFYANFGGGYFNGQPFTWAKNDSELYAPVVGFVPGPGLGQQTPIYGVPQVISGLRLVDSRASYGMGIQTMALGFPVHLDWSWKTLFNREWEDALFRPYGGSEEFRRVQFKIWIGYDF
jgi:hypothetical protein